MDDMPKYKYKGHNRRLTARKDRPQEVDTFFIDEDGFKRNWEKFKVELFWSSWHAKREKAGHGWIFTAMLNGTVERFRHAPYTYGHIVFYALTVVALGGIVGGIAKWAI